VTKAERKKKNQPSKSEIRKLCRVYAAEFVDIQREEFIRLGISADWKNPYLTMDFSYEAAIVREFGKFVKSGQVYKGKKPVHWCTSCRTALAEAEVEHADHESPSIYVKFSVNEGLPQSLQVPEGKKASVVIWTTTPWTLPANLAISVHPEFEYVALQVGDDVLIVAAERLATLVMEWGMDEHKVLGTCKGKDLDQVVCQHPFIDRESKMILGEHVTLEQGTGCVHTAPGHGQDDYVVGLKYGLEPYNPVNDAGVFVDEVEFFAGQFVTKANPEIIEKLRQDGALIKDEKIKHSYPHCWRCHKPVIFRATNQWFISMDNDGLRKKALEAIERVQWVPHWGRERIYNMIENRPDWCVSRQRAWGVPITIISCDACESIFDSDKVLDHIAALVEQHGADCWFDKPVSELLPEGTVCACGGTEFTKEEDILDVWFDSGVSHAAVLESNPSQGWPADLYLEGSDQHRGWFHSSLLESIGTRGLEPYKTVLTHGYVVDGKGKKMSKSAGNVLAPQKVIDQYGADILRLWVASENYREDIRVSQEILKRLTEAYRKMRNTFRFLLGNLNDFDIKKDRVPTEELLEIDRYILYRFRLLNERIVSAFEKFEFHTFYHSFYNFCVVDLSSFYLDIIKDRLYTYPQNSRGRRSAQTALHILLNDMVKMIAPVLSFTAEEIWSYCQVDGDKPSSVHLSSFSQTEEFNFDEALVQKWKTLVELKSEVSKALEISRRAKHIGHSLDAKVNLVLPENIRADLQNDFAELNFIFIVSEVNVVADLDGVDAVYSSEVLPGVQAGIQSMPGIKCERCWNYFVTSNGEAEHTDVCSRCTEHLQSAKA
jgi:isoleucyl-tRNA synthetase